MSWIGKLFGFNKKPEVKKEITPKDEFPKVEVKTEEVQEVQETKKKAPKKKAKRYWVNNGKEQKMIPVSSKIPKGWIKGKLKKGKK